MSYRPRIALELGLAALVLLAGACARTGLGVECPQGFEPVSGVCVCDSDQGCPTGYTCQGSICVCDSDSCCPAGFKWSDLLKECMCQANGCCPVNYAWDSTGQACVCAAAQCCPQGFSLDPATGRCGCSGDQCCPQGFVFVTDAGLPYDGGDGGRATPGVSDGGFIVYPDGGVVSVGAEFGVCACADDSCCPVDYRFDGTLGTCTCAKSACCPTNYGYDSSVNGCVCTGDACCPSGFTQNADQSHCICEGDSSCGVGQACNPDSGACLCVDNSACKSGDYCNALGFCQTLGGCEANDDCPAGTFCDVNSSNCVPNGICVLDDQCPFGQICNLFDGGCQVGCRTTDDCPLPTSTSQEALSCQGGQCVQVCESNDFCPFQEFCGPHTETPDCPVGQCCPTPDMAYCASCDSSNPTAGLCNQPPDSCLQFIVEGQTEVFCGVPCTVADDCPSGYQCNSTLEDCTMDPVCPDSTTGPATCKSFDVENQSTPEDLCADDVTGQPAIYQSFCSPISGVCPTTN